MQLCDCHVNVYLKKMLIQAEISQYSLLLNKATSEEEEKGRVGGYRRTPGNKGWGRQKGGEGFGQEWERSRSTERKQEKEKEVRAPGGQRIKRFPVSPGQAD